MDRIGEGRTTRASKRRRITPPQPLPLPRSDSPDELGDDSPSTPILSRQASTPTISQRGEPRRPSYSPVSSSPDELDHTSNLHTYQRTNPPLYRGSFSEEARQHDGVEKGGLRPPSPKTPEYSRLSTPIASPLPAQRQIREAKFIEYRLKTVLRGHKRGVAAVRFSPDGRLIGSCSADATIRIWDANNGKHLQTLEGHLAGISTLAWSPDNKTIASGSDDKSIRLWDVSTGKAYPHPLYGHHHYIYTIAFSPKGNILVSGSYDEAVILWDIRTRHILRTLPAHSDPVSGVDFIRDGTLIVSCSGDGLIRIWDTGTGQCLRTLVHEDNAPVTSVRFAPNGKFVLAWTLDSCVRLWNYVEGRCVKTYQGHENGRYSISGAFGIYGGNNHQESEAKSDDDDDGTAPKKAPKKAYIVSGSDDGRIVWWDVISKEILQIVQAHEGVVLSVDTREKGSVAVSGGIDKTIRIWERLQGGVGDENAGVLEEKSSSSEDRSKVQNGVKAEKEMPNDSSVDGTLTSHGNGNLLNGHATEQDVNGKMDMRLSWMG